MIKNYSLVLIAFLCCIGMGFGQPWAYDFGTSTGTYNTANGASTTFLPQPPLGGGEDRIRIGSGAGSWNMENQIISFGNQSYLRGVAPSGGSVNKFSVYDYDAGKTFTLKFDMLLGNSTGGNTANSGEWYLFVGDGATFSDSNGFNGAQTFMGIRLIFGSSGTITTNYRNGSSWTSMPGTPFSQGNSYSVEIFGNNSTGDLTYNNGSCQSVAANTFDLWVNGILIGNDLSKADIFDNVNIDSFMFYGISSTSNAANIFLDNFEYSNSFPVSTEEVDFCNVDFPETGSISVGGSFNVYAQAYEDGVTNFDSFNPGAGIQAWIGYSAIDATSTSDFASPNWTWVNASYINDVGNNDQFIGTFGSTLPSGTYYYVSRFQLNCGSFVYGGKTPNSLNDGGIWDNINYVSGILTIDQVDFCNLQDPSTHTMELCENFEVYGQVYEPGVTDIANNQGAGIVAEVGYSTSNTHPNTWTNWIPTTYNTNCTGGNFCNSNQNDEYFANLGAAITEPGTYYYAMRYRLNSGAYSYGGILADGSAGNFWDGITYISGVLTVNAPEIDVERNTGASIASSTCTANPANTGNNTLFAATSVGSTTTSKVYYIHNEGNADLTVTSIALNSGLDFNILNAPSLPVTISPGDSVSFEIEFAPNSVGSLEDTITILSNDCDESIYTFCIGGTGLCAASSFTISPSSGPVGTIVTVNGTNIGTASASFNGLSASVNHISSTEMEVIVPIGATTGNLEIIDDSSCPGTAMFNVIDTQIGGCEGGSSLAELFISEVTDSTYGSLTYIEIFNATGSAINLGNYSIRIYYNGSTTTYFEQILSGTINSGDTFVLTTGTSGTLGDFLCSVDGGDGLYGDLISSNLSGVNVGLGTDDYIGLYNSGVLIDEFGVFGDDSWTSSTILTGSRGFDFRRLNTATPLPSTVFSTGDWNIIDWAGSGSGSCSVNDYTDIGTYDFSTGVPPSITIQPIAPSSSCDLSASISVTATEGFIGGNPLTYQWYYSAPGDLGWTAVTNSAVYSGATSSTLNISNTLGLDDYQYYCEVREDDATCYQASNAVRLTVDVVTWDGSSWSNVSGPDINTIAIINGNYNTSIGVNNQTSFSACNLIVNSGTLTIADNNYVEVNNNLIVNSNIIVNPYGSFVQNSNLGTVTVANYNSITVEKLTAVANQWYEYTYWGSPVTNETIGNGLAEGTPSRRFFFNAANYLDSQAELGNSGMYNSGQDDIDDNANAWTYVSGTTVMQPGVGYACTLNSIIFNSTLGCNSPSGCQIKYTFNGAFNNGIITVPVYRNDSELNDNNWNFLGNPYPSAIDADLFLTANTSVDANIGASSGAIFFWSQNTPPSIGNSGNENVNFPQSDYAIINASGQTAGGDGVIPERYIPSCQGFFISYDDASTPDSINGDIATGHITFNNSMRVTGSNDLFFRSSNANNKVWLNLTSDNGVFNQVLVAYVEGASDEDDGMYYDAPRNLSTESVAIFYSLINDDEKKFAIQGKAPESLTESEVIPLGLLTNVDTPTIYTISISQIQGEFLTSHSVYLHDNFMGLFHDLTESDYNFTSEPGEFNDRFEIVFQTTTLSTDETLLSANDLTIVELPDGSVKFKVDKNHTIAQVEIIDLLGRTLYTLKGTSSEAIYFLPQLSQSAYIAKVTLDNGQTLSKKAIKKH